MGQPGLDWIAAALFAVGLTLLIGDAVIPGLGPGGVIGLICQIACLRRIWSAGAVRGACWRWRRWAAHCCSWTADLRASARSASWARGCCWAALWQTAQNITVFLLTLCASAVMTGIAIPLQLARLPESKTMKKIQLHARSEVPEQSADELPQVGALGVARTDLRPVGTVEIAEKRYEAVSAQHLRCGEAVRVTAVQGRRLRVEKSDEHKRARMKIIFALLSF